MEEHGCKLIPEITNEMIEAGFKVISTSGIADEYVGADNLLVVEVFQATLDAVASENQKLPR